MPALVNVASSLAGNRADSTGQAAIRSVFSAKLPINLCAGQRDCNRTYGKRVVGWNNCRRFQRGILPAARLTEPCLFWGHSLGGEGEV